MTIAGYKARNHPQQVRARGADEAVDDRATTAEVFAALSERFGGFTLDVAAAAHNAKCDRYFDVRTDGRAQPWSGERVWCNPPYSKSGLWVEKAWDESATAVLIVMLMPANRTEQVWWQRLVEPFRDRPGSMLTVEFLPGRLRFLAPGQEEIGPNERPPFGCCLLIWRRVSPVIDRGLFATEVTDG